MYTHSLHDDITAIVAAHKLSNTKKQSNNDVSPLTNSLFLSLCLSPSLSPRQCCGDSEVHRGQSLACIPPCFVYTETLWKQQKNMMRVSFFCWQRYREREWQENVSKNIDLSFSQKEKEGVDKMYFSESKEDLKRKIWSAGGDRWYQETQEEERRTGNGGWWSGGGRKSYYLK